MKVRVTYEETCESTVQYDVDDAEFDAFLADEGRLRTDYSPTTLATVVTYFIQYVCAREPVLNELDIERRRQGVARAFTGSNIVSVQVKTEED